MAELADAHGSGPCEVTLMQVQVLFPAPNKNKSVFRLVFVCRNRFQTYNVVKSVHLRRQPHAHHPPHKFPGRRLDAQTGSSVIKALKNTLDRVLSHPFPEGACPITPTAKHKERDCLPLFPALNTLFFRSSPPSIPNQTSYLFYYSVLFAEYVLLFFDAYCAKHTLQVCVSGIV